MSNAQRMLCCHAIIIFGGLLSAALGAFVALTYPRPIWLAAGATFAPWLMTIYAVRRLEGCWNCGRSIFLPRDGLLSNVLPIQCPQCGVRAGERPGSKPRADFSNPKIVLKKRSRGVLFAFFGVVAGGILAAPALGIALLSLSTQVSIDMGVLIFLLFVAGIGFAVAFQAVMGLIGRLCGR
jgi:hypothetical protein